MCALERTTVRLLVSKESRQKSEWGPNAHHPYFLTTSTWVNESSEMLLSRKLQFTAHIDNASAQPTTEWLTLYLVEDGAKAE